MIGQVTKEGGWDAAIEAPHIFAAMDVLAVRAAAWTERCQRLRQEGPMSWAAAGPGNRAPSGSTPPGDTLSPEEAARCAAAAVKRVRSKHGV